MASVMYGARTSGRGCVMMRLAIAGVGLYY
jgi:hypothetical protein